MDEIEYQGKRQLDVTDKQVKEQLKATDKQNKELKKIRSKTKKNLPKNWKGRKIRQDCVVKRQLKRHICDFWYKFYW